MNNKVIKGKCQPSLKFFNCKINEIQDEIWTELENGLWEQFSIDNALYNDAIGEVKQDNWKQVFPDFHIINPGFTWDYSNNAAKEELYRPKHTVASMDSFLNAVEKFFNRFAGKRIGVHLSGGFDSGLIS